MKISLIIPVLNEEAVIPLFYETVRAQTALQPYSVELVFVNDGSRDGTEKLITDLAKHDSLIILVNFSRNFGKEPALFAGLEYASGDVVIPIDVDLQDPIELIPLMLEKYHDGAEVVLAKRSDRSTDTWLKRVTAGLFYKLHNRVSSPQIEENVGDFRLLSRKAVEAVKSLPERQLFMKGVLSWVGFKTEIITYKRKKRAAGESKFNVWKLWNLAIEGLTSFSTAPLRVWSYVGAFVALLSFIYAVFIILDKLINGNAVSGYASIMTVMLFLGGIQLIGIGVLGEYLGRIYMESKERPRYIVSSVIGHDAKAIAASIQTEKKGFTPHDSAQSMTNPIGDKHQ